MQKDTRSGRCDLPDFGAELKLYEVEGSELRAICISEFLEEPDEHILARGARAVVSSGERPIAAVVTSPYNTVGWTEETFRTKIEAFYGKHNPDMVGRVADLLKEHKGRLDRLWVALHKKYGWRSQNDTASEAAAEAV